MLTGEGRTPGEMTALLEVEQFVKDGHATVFTSAITLVEVLELHLTPEHSVKFRGLVANPDYPFVPVDVRIGELAREIRDYHHARGVKIKTPDTIQLAVAIHYKADALHTYDGCGNKRKKTDLLMLPRPICGKYNIEISIPKLPARVSPLRGDEQLPLAEDLPETTESQ